MNIEFAASMMCANYANLEEEIRALEDGGIDSFHIDIMDGAFVPNFGMGIHDLKYLRSATKKDVEVHLMIQDPMRNLKLFIDCGVNVIYFHPEADYHPSTTIQHIIEAGITPGIAINPGTSMESVEELLYIVDRVLIMSVNPGNAGQVLLPYIGRKIEKFIDAKKDYNVKLYWDGSCSIDKIQTYAPMGMDGFVLGTASLFGHNRSYKEIITDIRDDLNKIEKKE